MEKENKKLKRCTVGESLVQKTKDREKVWRKSKSIKNLSYYNEAVDERLMHDKECEQCSTIIKDLPMAR